MNGEEKSKSQMIAEARQRRGMAPKPVQGTVEPVPTGRVPQAVQRAVQAPRAAPPAAPAQTPRPAVAAPQTRPAPQVRPPQRPVAAEVARVEQPEPRRLNMVEVGEDLARIARAFSRTPQFQNAPLVVVFEVHTDTGQLGVSVSEAIPGTMHPRFVADGVTLQEATAKLMRRFRQPAG